MDSVVHFEIPFDDKQRAMKFYGETFGWSLTDMPQMNYIMAESAEAGESGVPKEPGAINGGLVPRLKEAAHPVLYINVSSIDATIAKVTGAGGKVVTAKSPIPGMGAYARIADTEGNVVGLFETG